MSISIEAHDRICQDLHQQMRSLIVENERLKAAAQQALEALEGGADSWERVGPAIDALRAALAEDALQKFTDVSQEIEAALAEPVQEPNQP